MTVTELTVSATAQTCDSVTDMLRIWSWRGTINSTKAFHHFCCCCWSNSNQLQHSYTNVNPSVYCRSTMSNISTFIHLITGHNRCSRHADKISQFIQYSNTCNMFHQCSHAVGYTNRLYSGL